MPIKEPRNRPNKNILFYIFFAVLLLWLTSNSAQIGSFLQTAWTVTMPLVIGLVIAFIINIPMSIIESLLIKWTPLEEKKGTRIISMLFGFLTIILLLVFVVILVIPDLISTINSVINIIPDLVTNIEEILYVIFDDNSEYLGLIDQLDIDWQEMQTRLITFTRDSVVAILGNTLSLVQSIISGIIDFFLMIVFAIYVLMQKESLVAQAKRIIFAYIRPSYANSIIDVASLSYRTFNNFLTGQVTEAIITGFIVYIGMLIFDFPFKLSISVLTGVTTLIPIVGAIMGGAIGVLLIGITNPIKGLWFLLFIIVVQQIEGNIIYPRIVGSSVGLPGIWVLSAVLIGGGLFGLVGMLTAVPVAAVLYVLLQDNIRKRLEARDVEVDEDTKSIPQDAEIK